MTHNLSRVGFVYSIDNSLASKHASFSLFSYKETGCISKNIYLSNFISISNLGDNFRDI